MYFKGKPTPLLNNTAHYVSKEIDKFWISRYHGQFCPNFVCLIHASQVNSICTPVETTLIWANLNSM